MGWLHKITVNGWPPLASHTLMFLVGITVLHRPEEKRESAPNLKLPSLMVRVPKVLRKGVKIGGKFVLVKRDDAGSYCVRYAYPLEVFYKQKKDFYIKLPTKSWQVLEYLSSPRGLALFPPSRTNEMKNCLSETEIYYG